LEAKIGENMEYLVPQESYIVPEESLNFKEFDKSGIPFNIENNSDKENIIWEIHKDKKEFLEEVIVEIEGLIGQRNNIGENVIYKIEKELCDFNTKLCELDAWYKFSNKHVEKLRVEWELQVASLEKEKRFEEVSCFRDTSILMKDLRFFREELRKVLQKEKILSSS